jgi:hypothetical protein
MQIDAEGELTVRVVYSDGNGIFLGTSRDYGMNFPPEQLDVGLVGPNRMPRMCVDGNQIVVSWIGPASGGEDLLWTTVSEDDGETWSGPHANGAPLAHSVERDLAMACGPGGQVVLVWSQPDQLYINRVVYSLRYDGDSWGTLREVPLPFFPTPTSGLWPSAAFTGPDNVVLAYEIGGAGVYTVRSFDGGESWAPSAIEMSSGGNGAAYYPQVVSDGTGKAWVSWLDKRAGMAQVAMRYSPDHGASWFATYRMERSTPQGAHASLLLPTFQAAAALPGVGFTTWIGFRQTPDFGMPLLNAWDSTDLDRDTAPDASDCLFLDPTAFAVPDEIRFGPMQRNGTSAALLEWADQSALAGSGTTYDIVSGRLSDLRWTGDFSAATCLENGLTEAHYVDDRAAPPADDGDWYLLRAQNNCGFATFGDSTLTPDPRDPLDDFGTPCP